MNYSITEITAIFGVIIGSISLGWNILNEIRKKPKIDFQIQLMTTYDSVSKKLLDDHCIIYKITNISERNLTIKSIGFYMDKLHNLLITFDKLPKFLESGEFYELLYNYKKQELLNIFNGNIEKFIAYDSIGNKYKAKRINIKEFSKSLELIKKNNYPCSPESFVK